MDGRANIIMIRYNGKPEPPFDRYAAPFRTMNKVMWSIAGESGRTAEQRLDAQTRAGRHAGPGGKNAQRHRRLP